VDTVQLVTVDGRQGTGKVVSTDYTADLALVSSDLELPALETDSARNQRQGDQLLVLGYALSGVAGDTPTLTRGLFSALRRDTEGRLVVQTDAAMNLGSAGGAVLNAQGKLVGMVAFGLAGAEQVNFAIASDTIEAFLALPLAIRPNPAAAAPVSPYPADRPAVVAGMAWLQDRLSDADLATKQNDHPALRRIAAQVRAYALPEAMRPIVQPLARLLDALADEGQIIAELPGLQNNRTARDAMQANLQSARDQQARAKAEFAAALSQIQSRYGV
jgi:hypothetical protein